MFPQRENSRSPENVSKQFSDATNAFFPRVVCGFFTSCGPRYLWFSEKWVTEIVAVRELGQTRRGTDTCNLVLLMGMEESKLKSEFWRW